MSKVDWKQVAEILPRDESGGAGMSAGQLLQVGDRATTRFNGKPCEVVIVERLEGQRSQSGILFKVTPILRNGDADSLYDANWFRPIKDQP